MLIQETDLVLYNLTLQKQSNYIHSCTGNFINNYDEEVSSSLNENLQLCLATENHIELYSLKNRSLYKIGHDIPFFTIIKNVRTVRNSNLGVDYLIVTSDSGNIAILRFQWNRLTLSLKLEPICIEPIARSGLRRLSPVEYIAVDKHSRCVMISAVEKFKYCYMLSCNSVDIQQSNNNNNNDNGIISSPLEAVRSDFITLDLVACDMGYIDNPCFASLEMGISKSPSSNNRFHLIFYMMDLNLNCIVKKADYIIPGKPNILVSLPNLAEYGMMTNIDTSKNRNNERTNPFVLIGLQDSILIKDLYGYYNIKIALPKSKQINSPTVIISSVFRSFKKQIFILLQTNHGDLLKLKIIPNNEENNRPLCIIRYFDSIPVAEQLHITTNGLLFANTEFNKIYLFQFESLGEDSLDNNDNNVNKEQYFNRSDSLQNLSILESKNTLNPLNDARINKGSSDNQAIVPFKLWTNTIGSTIRSMVNCVNIETLISSPLPPAPKNIWTLKKRLDDDYHTLVTMAFNQYTVFLKIEGESMQTLSFKEPMPFIMKNDPTIYMTTLNPNILIQVCSNQFTQVITTPNDDDQSDGFKKVHEWFPPAGIIIVSATSTASQLIVALSNNNILYFEINNNGNTLMESSKTLTVENNIVKIAVDENKFRCDHLIVATKDDQLINVVSLKTSKPEFMEILSFQQLDDEINDIVMNGRSFFVGLVNGIYVKSNFTDKDGEIINTTQRFMGTKPIQLSIVDKMLMTSQEEDSDQESDEEDEKQDGTSNGKNTSNESDKEHSSNEFSRCVIIHSDNIWVDYEFKNLTYIRPVALGGNSSYLNKISPFSTSTIDNNGICGLSSSGSLVIGKLKDFVHINNWFLSQEFSLDNNEKEGDEEDENEEDDEEDEDEDDKIKIEEYQNKIILPFNNNNYTIFIANHIDPLVKKCRLNIVDSNSNDIIMNVDSNGPHFIMDGIQCITAQIVNFTKNKNFVNLVISTRDQLLFTFQLSIESVKKVVRFRLTLLHQTKVESPICAMSTINSKLLVNILDFLVIYDLGKKQLLKKTITKVSTSINKTTAIDVWDNTRIALGDIHESVTIFQFDEDNNQFYPIADDIVKRHVTSLKFIDSNTIIGGDRFGNIWTLRVPQDIDMNKIIKYGNSIHSNVKEAPYKLELKNHYFINDIPMWFSVVQSLQMSDRPAILYGGLQGSIGVLSPLLSKLQIKTIMKLQESIVNIEMLVLNDKMARNSIDDDDEEESENEKTNDEIWINQNQKDTFQPEGYSSLVDRDHSKYRGYYAPVRNVIDGDLCEQFLTFNSYEQNLICQNISKKTTINDVILLINEIRSNYM